VGVKPKPLPTIAFGKKPVVVVLCVRLEKMFTKKKNTHASNESKTFEPHQDNK
jgi:hypothetical protein